MAASVVSDVAASVVSDVASSFMTVVSETGYEKETFKEFYSQHF